MLSEQLPGAAIAAGATVDVPLAVSQWSSPTSEPLRVAVRWGDGPVDAEADVDSVPYGIAAVSLSTTAPTAPGPAAMVVELRDAAGEVRARNVLDVVIE